MKEKSKGWIWFFICFAIAAIYGATYHKVTSKDLAREASGRQVVASDASYTEKRGVVLLHNLLTLRKENDLIAASFANSQLGQHLMEPSTMTNPMVAAESLKEFRAFRAATETNHTKQMVSLNELQVLSNGTAIKPWMTAEYDATEAWFSAIDNVYAYVADPAHNVHVIKDTVVINGADEYNRRVEGFNAANQKFAEAEAAFKAGQEKQQQSIGVTPEELGLKENK
jgi:hypothetical protein